MANCRSCGKEIIWAKMEKTGELHPIDANSVKTGIVLSGDKSQCAVRKVGISHFSTCPQANKHRKKGGE